MNHHHAYDGTMGAPLPPVMEHGWYPVSPDHPCFHAAQQMAGSGVLGELPLHHYQDVRSPTGLYRFFHYDSPVGGQIGALHFDGTIGITVPVDNSGGDPSASSGGDQTNQTPTSSNGSGGSSSNSTQTPTPEDGSSGTVTSLSSTSTAGVLGDDGGDTYTQTSPGSEPIPQNTASCTWVPDTSNAAVVAIAGAISNGSSSAPVKFQNQAVYNTTVAGVAWKLVMWSGDCRGDGGTYNCVSTFRCQPGGGPSPNPSPNQASTTSGSTWGILALVAAAILGIGGAAAAHKKAH